jgi:peptidoglycan hydrolase-like protein with peptidoglycan-binding domain
VSALLREPAEDESSSVSKLVSSRQGVPLEAETRRFMENRFGYDFSDVRIHTGSAATDAARSVSAHAFTIGTDIAFAGSNYSPATPPGDKVLAHELTHVIQQKAGPVNGAAGHGGVLVSDPRDPSEQEAEGISDLVMSSPATSCNTRSSLHTTEITGVEQGGMQRESELLLGLQRSAGNLAVSTLLMSRPRGPNSGLVLAREADEAAADAAAVTSTARSGPRVLLSPHWAGNERLQRAVGNSPPLHQDERGEAVSLLQQALVQQGFEMPGSTRADGSVDGIWGAETTATVRAFQEEAGVRPVGGWEAGKKTLSALDDRLLAAGPAAPAEDTTASEGSEQEEPPIEPQAGSAEPPLLKPLPGLSSPPSDLPEVLGRGTDDAPDIIAQLPNVLGFPGAKKQDFPKPTGTAFTTAENCDQCIRMARGLLRTKGASAPNDPPPAETQACLRDVEALPMRDVITTMQSLRLNFRDSFHVAERQLDPTSTPKVALARNAITVPDSFAGRDAKSVSTEAAVTEADAKELIVFVETVSGRSGGMPEWGRFTTVDEQHLHYIRDFRQSVRDKGAELRKHGRGLEYFGHSSRDVLPTEVAASPTPSLEREMWDELQTEGGSSAINTWDTALLTWGRGFAASGLLPDLIDQLYLSAPRLIDELYQAGFALPRGSRQKDFMAVDLATGQVIRSAPALEMLRADRAFNTVLIALAESEDYAQQMADAQWNLLKKRQQLKPLVDPALRAKLQADNWPTTSIRFVEHAIHAAGKFTWNHFIGTKGDLRAIASIYIRGLPGDFPVLQSGARIAATDAARAPLVWGKGILQTLLSAAQPVPPDIETNTAHNGKAFLAANADKGAMPASVNIQKDAKGKVISRTTIINFVGSTRILDLGP